MLHALGRLQLRADDVAFDPCLHDVGFGTDSPGACAGPQLLVFLEHFVGCIDVAFFTAVILSKLLQPSPAVRFSKHFLVCDELDGKWLTIRMVRESPHQLRDCELSLQCGLITRGEGGVVTGCTEEALPLQCAFKSNLETWFVRHQIDARSPLRRERLQDLAYMNVTLKVFDTAFMQEVRLYHNYTPSTDVVYDARFEVMKSWEIQMGQAPSDRAYPAATATTSPTRQHSAPVIHGIYHTVDHAKLDAYREASDSVHVDAVPV